MDDEKEFVRALQRSLTAYGYTVLTASNGEDALKAVHRHHPDGMLLDLALPDMSGLEVCQRIQAESNLPIILTSSSPSRA